MLGPLQIVPAPPHVPVAMVQLVPSTQKELTSPPLQQVCPSCPHAWHTPFVVPSNSHARFGAPHVPLAQQGCPAPPHGVHSPVLHVSPPSQGEPLERQHALAAPRGPRILQSASEWPPIEQLPPLHAASEKRLIPIKSRLMSLLVMTVPQGFAREREKIVCSPST